MPMDRSKYPENWEAISRRIRFQRAQNRCECEGECGLHEGRCTAKNYTPHPVTKSKVILTVAHLDQDTYNNFDSNLKAMCQRCHLTYDRKYYKEQRLAWVKTLEYTDLDVLLSALDTYAVDVISKHLGTERAKAIWGDDYIDSLDEIRTVLSEEWEERTEPK